jgi:hypothetical protein
MSNATLIKWNDAKQNAEFLRIRSDGSFEIQGGAPTLFVLGQLVHAFLKQQDRIKRLEEWKESAMAVEREWNPNSLSKMLGGQLGESQRVVIMREVPKLQDRIERLEEAGDAMAKRTYDEISRDAWRKAKEAKLCIKQLKTKSCIYCMKVECECSDFDVSADMGAKG